MMNKEIFDRVTQRLETWRRAREVLEGLEELQKCLSLPDGRYSWNLLRCDTDEGDCMMRMEVAEPLLAELLGAGLRTLLPTLRARLEEFDLHTD